MKMNKKVSDVKLTFDQLSQPPLGLLHPLGLLFQPDQLFDGYM